MTVLILLTAVPLAVSAGNTNVSISSVTVSPSAPAPGETVTLTPVVKNLQSSQSAFEMEAIAVRTTGDTEGVEELDRNYNLGSLSPGSSLEVSLVTKVNSPGVKNLRVIVYGHPAGKPTQNTKLTYPVSFTVQDRDPQVDLRANDSIAGVSTSGTVTIANGLESELTNVEVSVSGTGVELLEDRGIVASLSPGETATVPVRLRPNSAGDHELTATVNYIIDGSTQRTVNQSATIQTSPSSEGAKLSVAEVGSGPERTLVVDVVNPSDHPIQNVLISGTSNNATFDESIISSVPSGESHQVRINTTVVQTPATARITARYSIGGSDRTSNTTVEMSSDAGSVTLTGLDVTQDSGKLRISGSASNVGTSTVNSVIVSVRNTERVNPAFPNKEYFIGTVPSSDFVSFDVYTRTTGNVSTVPLTVSYSLDGEQFNREFAVETGETNATSRQFSERNSLPSGVALGLGAVVTLAVGAIMVVGWRASRDDS